MSAFPFCVDPYLRSKGSIYVTWTMLESVLCGRYFEEAAGPCAIAMPDPPTGAFDERRFTTILAGVARPWLGHTGGAQMGLCQPRTFYKNKERARNTKGTKEEYCLTLATYDCPTLKTDAHRTHPILVVRPITGIDRHCLRKWRISNFLALQLYPWRGLLQLCECITLVPNFHVIHVEMEVIVLFFTCEFVLLICEIYVVSEP